MKTTLTRAALYGLLAAAVTRRKIVRRRAYYRSLAAVRRPRYPARPRGKHALTRWLNTREVVYQWRQVHYAPERQAFLAELAALCNAHRFVVCQTEYDGPLEAVPMKRKAQRLTARTVLAQ